MVVSPERAFGEGWDAGEEARRSLATADGRCGEENGRASGGNVRKKMGREICWPNRCR